jgi:hypothetical protein
MTLSGDGEKQIFHAVYIVNLAMMTTMEYAYNLTIFWNKNFISRNNTGSSFFVRLKL